MRVLVIGDVVGASGINILKRDMLDIIENKKIDFVIVNGENSANGKGLRIKEYEELIKLKTDVITMGNHIYYRKEMATEYSKISNLLIPANITNMVGNGNVVLEKNGFKIAVINIIGKVSMGEVNKDNISDPFKEILNQIDIVEKKGADYIFVDFHAEATAEKIAMGYFLKDKITCMFGTHTHVQTADEEIIDGKMAYITDVGMTGPKDSVIGLKKEVALKRFVQGAYAKYECSTNEAKLNGIVVEIDDDSKKPISITRINY